MIDLVGEIQPSQGHAEQEPETGHRPIAVAEAHAALGEMQLEAADVLSACGVGGALQERGKSPAAANVAFLGPCREPARVHVLDHALA